MTTITEAGPSRESIRECTRELSKILISFENLLIKTPEGVTSKKEPGLRTYSIEHFIVKVLIRV